MGTIESIPCGSISFRCPWTTFSHSNPTVLSPTFVPVRRWEVLGCFTLQELGRFWFYVKCAAQPHWFAAWSSPQTRHWRDTWFAASFAFFCIRLPVFLRFKLAAGQSIVDFWCFRFWNVTLGYDPVNVVPGYLHIFFDQGRDLEVMFSSSIIAGHAFVSALPFWFWLLWECLFNFYSFQFWM